MKKQYVLVECASVHTLLYYNFIFDYWIYQNATEKKFRKRHFIFFLCGITFVMEQRVTETAYLRLSEQGVFPAVHY